MSGIENLSPRTRAEKEIATRSSWNSDTRLACQTFVKSDATGSLTLKRLVQERNDLRSLESDAHAPSSRETNLAVMFTDLRNFTKFAEERLPYDVVHALNRFFNEIGQPIIGEGGYIDKYTGDGCMALFGLEDRDPYSVCISALRAALGMQVRLDLFNSYLEQNFHHKFEMGIGIAYGPAIIL